MVDKTHTAEEVAVLLAKQSEQHQAELREQAMDYRLEHIDHTLSSVNEKVCKHVDDAKKEKEKILIAIENVGAERRHCEERVNGEIKDMHEYNHKTFVKKTDLRVYAVLIVFAVTSTVSVITWYGPQKSVSAEAVNQIAKSIIKELGK